MTLNPCIDWLRSLQTSCAEAGLSSLHLIYDQAGGDVPLLPSVLSVEPALQCQSLFTSLPPGTLDDLAPLLIRLDLDELPHRQWLAGVMQRALGRSQLLVLASAWPFEALAAHLGQCTQGSNGGYLGLFRFYDPRLFALLFSHALPGEHQQLFLDPAAFWSWLDRDDMPQWLAGQQRPFTEPLPLTCVPLQDGQLETLSCAHDAATLITHHGHRLPASWRPQQRFERCFAAMLDASQAGLFVDSEREAFALRQVTSQ